jgi:hypothetical protein
MEQQTKVEKLIPLQNKLKMKKKFVDIVELIINDVKKNIPEFENHKLDCELIVEYLVKKKYKVDKKQVVLHVFELLFSDITNDDLEFVSNTIDFLFQHDQIKQVKMISKVALGCGDLITRKFL